MPFIESLFQRTDTSPPPDAKADNHPTNPAVIEAGVATLKAFWDDVKRLCPEAFGDHEMGLTALSVYAYGGLIVLTEERAYCPVHARVVFRTLLRDLVDFPPAVSEAWAKAREETVFKHSLEQSSELHPVIHRGAFAFRKWQEQRGTFDAADFKALVATNPFWKP